MTMSRAAAEAPPGAGVDSCVARLAQLGTLAGWANRSSAKSGSILPAKSPPDLDRALAANGVDRLLPILPFGTQTLARMQQAALIGSFLETIQRNLGIDLRAATPDQLTSALAQIAPRIPALPLPRAEAAAVSQLSQVGPAAIALRAQGVDIFGPCGARDLKDWFSSPEVSAILAGAGHMPLSNATLAGLTRLANVSAAAQQLEIRRGEERPRAARSSRSLGSGATPAGAPALQSLAAAMQTARLPRPAEVSTLNAQLGGLKAIGRVTGLDPKDRRAGAAAVDLMRSLKAGGTCEGLKSTRVGPAQTEALARLDRFASCRESIRETAKFDILDRDASQKLSHAVDRMRPPARAAAVEPAAASDLMAALSHLAGIGSAVSSGWMRKL